MTMVCKVCIHPDRAEIDRCLVDAVPVRGIANRFGVHRSSLDRHKKHIPKALAVAKQAETVAESTSLLSRVEKLYARCESAYDRALRDDNWTGAAAFARELRGSLELVGKISGQLQSSGTRVAIAIGEIRSMDVSTLTKEQVVALYDRVQAEGLREVRAMSDEELDAAILGILLEICPDGIVPKNRTVIDGKVD